MRFWLVLFCLFPLILFTQNNGQFIEASQDIRIPFTITQYNTKHGLPQSQVNSIIQKENGNLIIGTSYGIIEFNGEEFKEFIPNNTYKNYNITKLIWNENSKQLFGQELGGTSHLINPQYSKINEGNYLNIYNNSLFVINNLGEIFLSNNSDLKFKKTYSTGIINPSYLYINGSNAFISNKNGLYNFDFATNKILKISEKQCYLIKTNSFSNELFLMFRDEICTYRLNKINSVFKLDKVNSHSICTDIDFMNEEEFVVATTHGFYNITKDYTDAYTKKSELPSNFIQSLYYKKDENCLFLGSGDKGLFKLQLKDAYTFYTSQGLAETSTICSIIKSKSGKTITVDGTGAIYQLGIDSTKQLSTFKHMFSCLTDINDTLYAGTWGGGIKVINENKLITSVTGPNYLPNNNVHSIFRDSEGNLWIGTNKGISFGKNIYTIKPILQNKIIDNIICFYELKNGNICVGSNNGVFIISKKMDILLHLNKKVGLIAKEVRGFYEDAECKIWIATYGGGIYCLKNNKLTSINKMQNCKLNQNAFCLANDQYGYIYITSNNGLWRVKESDLNDFYNKRKNTLIPFYYGEETGIINTEFNGGFQNNYLKTKHDLLYFPSLQGVVLISPDEPLFKKNKTNIESVFVNDSLYNVPEHKFNRLTKTIKFNFSCPYFISKRNVYYQYKLEGTKVEDWSILNKNKSITFNLLPPGKYIFTIRAVDAFNDPNPPETSYAFEITPYFYETIWFKFLSFALFLIATIIIGRTRVQMYRKQAEQKESLAKQIAELELKAIQSQLNPHFIFNCMNTIKYFIMDKKFEEANSGLNKLSKLLRHTIEDSPDFISTLKTEINLVENYLSLEKMRLQDQLNWEIKIDPAISENTLYPRLFIQTFVENSIKHGISNLINKKGLVEIEISQTDTDITCIIKDNGIGRTAAIKLNEKSPVHKSKGRALIEEKKKYLNTFKKCNIEIETIDLKDVNNMPTGTLITIKTPRNL